jgi:hypothetical protein
MENITELLKKSTTIKNEKGYLEAIDFVKRLIDELNLEDKDIVRCSKKILSFIIHLKNISFEEVNIYFQNILFHKLTDSNSKYELYTSLCDFYIENKQFEFANQMNSGAIASIEPIEFEYLHKLRNSFNTNADLALLSPLDEREKSMEYIFNKTSACIFEIIAEINFSITDKLRFYYEYLQNDLSDDPYLNDEDGKYDRALNELGLLNEKNEILSKIHKFVTFDIPKKMGFSERMLNGENDLNSISNIKPFKDITLILDFVKSIYIRN